MTENKNDSGWNKILVKSRCEWARVLTSFKAGWTGNREAYTIALELSQAQLHKLSQLGYKGVAKPSKTEGKFVYNFKRFTATLKGVPITALQVMGWDKQPFTELVGDGSLVIALLEYANYSSGSNADGVAYPAGVSFRLGGVQVVEHVPYDDDHANKEEYEKSISDSFKVQPMQQPVIPVAVQAAIKQNIPDEKPLVDDYVAPDFDDVYEQEII